MNKFIEKIGIDKICHFGMGGLIAAFVAIMTMIQELPLADIWFALGFPLIGSVAALILACMKEFIIDEQPNKDNILWTFYGSLAVWIAFIAGIVFNILSK